AGLDGVVQQIGYRGGISLYRVRLDNGLVLKAATMNSASLIGQSIAVGDRVALSWAADAAVVLPQ
ncbi:MAG TPA: TOBE domain-containing protein, partial [Nitrobacter sp.]|nr:TOBE domain-containing protein [Nitrobacter sp.]